MQGVCVPCLVRELRSDMPLGQKNIKQKQHCNKLIQTLKNGPHQKKKELLEVFEQGGHIVRSE